MQFTRASVVAAIAVAAIAVGTPERADAQQPPRPDSIARRDSIARADSIAAARRTPATPVRKDPTAPAPSAPAMPAPTPAVPRDTAAQMRDSLQVREAAGDVALTPERLVIVIDSADVRTTALATTTVNNVQLVSVADVIEAQVIADALTRNDAALARLRTALIANQAVAQALANASPAINAPQIVGAELHEGGHLVVYYRPMP